MAMTMTMVRLARAVTKAAVQPPPSASASAPAAAAAAAAAAVGVPRCSMPSTTSATSASTNSNTSSVRPYSSSTPSSLASSSPAKKNVTASAADRRLAGRRRFYKNVGIAPSTPPGHHLQNHHQQQQHQPPVTSASEVNSPISAGVDGTQSASGVNNTLPTDSSLWETMLHPRRRHHVDSNNEQQSWHTITLDNRALRTPLGLPLSLPSQTLALAVASEWDAQSDYLRPAQMPLMTLCCTAIDQVASQPDSHRTDILRYLANDTSCYWSDPTSARVRVLHRKQMRAWGGLHDTVSNSVLGLPMNSDVNPAFAIGEGEAISLSRRGSSSSSSSGLPHPPILLNKATKWVHSLDAWMLSALYSACAESKSFFIGAALIHEAMNGCAGGGGRGADDESGTTATSTATKKEGRAKKNEAIIRDGKWAVEAARVEEEFNIECWGLVEGGHDYDRLNCSIQMHAASFLARTVANG